MSTRAPATSVLPLGYYCGFLLLRALAARDRSQVYLARDGRGEFGALKVHGPLPTAGVVELAARIRHLKDLGAKPGLLPILDLGTTPDGRVWEWLPLADNLPGLLPLTDTVGLEEYAPLTLRSRITEVGPAPATQVARWGLRLTEGLAALHAAGLVHRDVKPGNVLFVRGEPCLADYGLAGESGGQPQFNGTEGYRPLEGTSDAGADIFALGKTLYEGWTGQDRLEFPSLPRAVSDAPSWATQGVVLNDVLLRACDAQAARRFGSAKELATALEGVLAGRPRVTRRRWLVATTGLALAGGVATGVWFLRRPPARLVWRRVREKGFNLESWRGHAGSADWERGEIYSMTFSADAPGLQSVNLKNFGLVSQTLTEGLREPSTFLHPETREVWGVERGLGEVFALNPATGKGRSLGGGPSPKRHHGQRPYWNPVTRRMGVFGGYGMMAVTNARCEFDPPSRQWLMLEADREGPGPCRRGTVIPLAADATGTKLYLVGGHGGLSGKQNEETPRWGHFDGRFHWLDDVWELDLRQPAWRCLLPLGHLDPVALRATAYFPELEGLVIFEGTSLMAGKSIPARAFLLRPDRDREPVLLPSVGEVSRLAQVWTSTRDPNTGELLIFAPDGIFRVSARAT